MHYAHVTLIAEIICAARHIILQTSNWQVVFTIARWIHSMGCVDCSCQSLWNFKV